MITVKGNTPKEKMLFMLDYVKNYFNSNNRAITFNAYGEKQCVYYDENTKNKCAIGIFLPNVKEYQNYQCCVNDLLYDYVYLNDHKNFKNIPIGFLQSLQELHDDENNWYENGLSSDGTITYNNIKNNVINDCFEQDNN